MDRSYSNHTADAVPAFNIPLTDAELLALGRLTAIWSQVDLLLDLIIERTFDIAPPTRDILVGERMAGAKIKLIEDGCKNLDDSDMKAKVEEFASLARAVKNKRNHACHGVWGWKTHPKPEKMYVCARQTRDPEKPLTPKDLTSLVRDIANCARIGIAALQAIDGMKFNQPAALLYGKEDIPPTWLAKP